jgi:hypothetical protein
VVFFGIFVLSNQKQNAMATSFKSFEDETNFLLTNTPLYVIVEQYGGKLKGKQKYNPNTDNQYELNGDIINIMPSTKAKNKRKIDLYSLNLEQGKGGNAARFIMYKKNCSMKEAYDELRNINKVDKGTYQRQEPGKIDQAPEQAELPEVIIPFQPSDNVQFFLDRGISKETLESPLFKDRFGANVGPYGGAQTEKEARFKSDDLVYPNDTVIPYFNIKGEVVNLEYKNKLTDASYTDLIERAVRNGESINKVRKNPSSFIAGASKKSIWFSAIPEKPTHVLVSEQPADAMAFYQQNIEKRPELANAVFIGIGGNLSQHQIPLIAAFIKELEIKNVEFIFDNDVHGFRYATAIKRELSDSLPVEVSVDEESTYSIGLSFFTSTILKKEDFSHHQQELAELVQKQFPDNKDSFFPFATAGGTFGVLNIPYTPENATKAFEIFAQLTPTIGYDIKYHLPGQAKDWNDNLQQINNVEVINSVHISAFENEQKVLLLDSGNTIFLQHKKLNTERTITEALGTITFLGDQSASSRLQLSEAFIGNPQILEMVKNMDQDLQNLVPSLDNRKLLEIFNQDIYYSHSTREFKRSNGDTLATLSANDELNFIKGVNLSEGDVELIEVKAEQVRLGQTAQMDRWKFQEKELYDGKYDNHRLRYVETTNTVFLSQDVARWDEDRNGAKWIEPVTLKFSENQKITLKALFDAYRERNLHERGSNQYWNAHRTYQDISNRAGFKIEHGVVRYLNPVAQWDQGLNRFIASQDAVLTKNQKDVLDRFSKYKVAGRDILKPGLIGVIDDNFHFKTAKGFDPTRDLLADEQRYFKVLNLYLKDQQLNLAQFREMYPEPVVAVSSGSNQLKWGNQECYTYVPEKKGIIIDREFVHRAFNPTFWKQAEVFLKNEGSYFGYDKNVRVNLETNDLFYKDPNFKIGKVVKDDEGKFFFALYANVPEEMKDEIRMISAIPEASYELVKLKGLDLSTGIGKIKEKKLEVIPKQYAHFFEKGDKFKLYSKEELKTKNKRFCDHYMQAYLWYKDNIAQEAQSAQLDNQNTRGMHLRGMDLFFGRVKFGKYDTELDRLILNWTADSKHYQDLAFIEKQVVKNLANRQFGPYLAAPSEEKVIANKQIVRKLLEEIDVDGAGLVKFRHNDFKIRNFAKQDGDKLIVESSIKDISPDLNSAIEIYAKAEKLIVEYVEALSINDKGFSVSMEDENVDLTFNHTLRLSNEGILKTLVNTEEFNGVVVLNADNSLSVKFLSNAGGKLEVPLHEAGNQNGLWLSRFPEDKLSVKGNISNLTPTLIVCETPEYGLLHYQNDLLRTINQANYYVSMPGASEAEQNDRIQMLIKQTKIDTVQFVGTPEFTDKFYDLYTGNNFKVNVSPPDLKNVDTLASVKKEISTVPPDPMLQFALDDLAHKNIYNVADGIGILPISNHGGRDKAIVGKVVKTGKIKGLDGKRSDAVYLSASSNPQRITIAPNLQEAIYYMAINKEYIKDERVVACTDTFTSETAGVIKSLLKQPRFGDEDSGVNISIINSPKDRFYTTIAQSGMKILRDAMTPAPSAPFKSYQDEYIFKQEQINNFNTTTYVEVISLGKNNAPDASARQEHEYEVIESINLNQHNHEFDVKN